MYRYPEAGYGYIPCGYCGVPFVYPSMAMYPAGYMQNSTYPLFSRGRMENYEDSRSEENLEKMPGNFENVRMKTVDISEIRD